MSSEPSSSRPAVDSAKSGTSPASAGVSGQDEGRMGIPPELRSALRGLREVRSRKPVGGALTEEFALWREQMADALQDLSCVLLFEEDRMKASGEAEVARAEAGRIRRKLSEKEF